MMYLTIVTVAVLRLIKADSSMCDQMADLSDYQWNLCATRPDVFGSLSEGLITARNSCVEVLSDQVWNCSEQLMTRKSQINYGVVSGTPESAIVSAIKSAGMTYNYAKSCAAGKLLGCECLAFNQDHPNALPQEIWSWSGCLESLTQAQQQVYNFVYSWKAADQLPIRRYMDVHNEVVGTQVLYNLVTRQSARCKCHGISGSCAVRTCWVGSTTFGPVAQELKSKYLKAQQFRSVAGCNQDQSGCEDQHTYESLTTGQKVDIEELIYLDPPEDYCSQYAQTGRICARGNDFDRCESVCCGRFETAIEVKQSRCNLRTEGCCSVIYDLCKIAEKQSTCL